jgi:Family of unknown function (DUF6516)
MIMGEPEYALEFLLAFNGRIHWLEQGYSLRFKIARVKPSARRPHGLSYSFTFHDPRGKRLIGFDNAHRVSRSASGIRRRSTTADHWHRTETDEGRPYAFVSAEQLLEDFFREFRRVLDERGLSDEVISVEESR